MRILTIILCVLLLICIGGGALFYMAIYQPLATENERMKSGIPELDKAKAELKKFKDGDAKEKAWTTALSSTMTAGLGDEIKAGKAEVLAANNKVLINISEGALFLSGSKTFAKESPQLLLKLESLLRSEQVKGKDIYVGNTTQSPAVEMRGKRKVTTKDAVTLAAERSIELIKYFGKKGIAQEALIAVAYSPNRQPEAGLKINTNKTMIMIANPAVLSASTIAQDTQAASLPSSKGSVTASSLSTHSTTSQVQSKPISTVPNSSQASKPIPIRPAQTKPN